MVILSSPQQSERAEIGELCFRYVTMFLNVPVHHGQNKANKIFIANLGIPGNTENHNPAISRSLSTSDSIVLLSWELSYIPTRNLRSHPHTPGRYPGCFTNSLWRNSFFLGVRGSLGYFPRVYMGKIIEKRYVSVDGFSPKKRPKKNRKISAPNQRRSLDVCQSHSTTDCWNGNSKALWPIESMGLVYLPTFTP